MHTLFSHAFVPESYQCKYVDVVGIEGVTCRSDKDDVHRLWLTHPRSIVTVSMIINKCISAHIN